MSETTPTSPEPRPLVPELTILLPEFARQALFAELRSGNACGGFGGEVGTDADHLYRRAARGVWREAGIEDSTFDADFPAINDAIAAQGGPEAVRDAYLAQQQEQQSR